MKKIKRQSPEMSVDDALRLAEKELKAIKAVPRGTKRTLSNTLEPLNRAAIAIGEARSRAQLLSAVHPDAKVRKAAERSTQKLAKFFSKLYLWRDLYEAVKDVRLADLDEDAKRFRSKELMEFTLMGVDKPAKVRREIKKLINRSVKLSQAFDRNIKDENGFLLLKEKDLEGLPEDYRKAHVPDGKGMVRIFLQLPDYFPFMQYAVSSEARRRLSFLWLNRGWPKNEKVLKELLAVRSRWAHLLGYKNWADYVTVDKMSGSAKTVRAFLDRVAHITKRPAKKDIAALLSRKRKDDAKARLIEGWEVSYYENLVLKEHVKLDTQEVRNYFSFKRVEEGVLKTTGYLFGLSYKRVAINMWHPDVQTFDVYQAKKRIGRFYLDLHPRPNKYNHAACFDIRPGIRGKQLPEAALVCNFSQDLMSFREVTTFFHEFGHLIHFILAGDKKWGRFSGVACDWDFVEAPSQMLEEWALDFETLKTFARHHKTKKPIPMALVEKMNEAEKFGKGIAYEAQAFYAAVSLRYHTEPHPKHIDLLKILRQEEKKYDSLRQTSGTHFYANFGHLNHYSALYYTYLWSLAIAQDILVPFKKNGMRNRATAKRYAEKILMPGGSKDARVLIHDFLGRDWNLEAFRRWINN